MRGRPSAWPTRSSALSRGDSTPFEPRNSEVFFMTSMTVSMGACRAGGWPPGRSAQLGRRPHELVGAPLECGKPLLVVRLLEGLDQGADRALHHLREPVEGEADPVVRHAVLGEIIGPDPLAAVPGADLAAALRGVLGLLLVLLQLQEP